MTTESFNEFLLIRHFLYRFRRTGGSRLRPESLTCRTAAFRLLLTFADAFRVAPLGNAQSAWAKEVEAGGDCRLTPLPWT
jgi:hypothetical protein